MRNNFTIMTSLLIFISTIVVVAQVRVTFDANVLNTGTLERGDAGLNLCWLLDSDLKRPRNTSNALRFAEMGIKVLRYPYGHLADNYLWDTPPFGGNLVPKIASRSETPAQWSWATNSDGTLNKSMDFDEYMAICQKLNIKPLVVVNALSHKYSGGPTFEELKETAIEWIKYAKEKNYKVAYWQIGNEVEHHPDVITRNEYIELYLDFASAMKKVDPSAVIGPGLIGNNTSWLEDLLSRSPQLVDFTSVHQYLFSKPFKNYAEWLNHNGNDLNPKISIFQSYLDKSVKPELPILITETNAYGNWEEKDASLYKGLAWFDMLMSQHVNKNVKHSYIWNSHSPWVGESGNAGAANALANNGNNDITSMGLPLKIFNTTVQERYLKSDNKVNGVTYSYGTYTPSTGNMTIYLMNKSLSPVKMSVLLNNYKIKSTEKWVWTGKSHLATTTKYTKQGKIAKVRGGFETQLPAHSLVVVKLSGGQ